MKNNEQIKQEIKEYPNPYPRDVFDWENKEPLYFTRGRFNRFMYNVIESARADMLRIVEEE